MKRRILLSLAASALAWAVFTLACLALDAAGIDCMPSRAFIAGGAFVGASSVLDSYVTLRWGNKPAKRWRLSINDDLLEELRDADEWGATMVPIEMRLEEYRSAQDRGPYRTQDRA